MGGAQGCGRGASRLAAGKRRVLQAAAVGALTLPGALTVPEGAWAQVAATLPEVTVTAPRPAPVRRAAPARNSNRAHPSARSLASVCAGTRAPNRRVPGCRHHAHHRSRLRFGARVPAQTLARERALGCAR